MSATNKTEFIVTGTVAQGQSGLLHVIGRCGSRPIPKGYVFTLAYRNKPRKYPDEVHQDPIRLEQQSIALQVGRIHAYENDRDELGPAMIGSLGLCGQEP